MPGLSGHLFVIEMADHVGTPQYGVGERTFPFSRYLRLPEFFFGVGGSFLGFGLPPRRDEPLAERPGCERFGFLTPASSNPE